MSGTMEDEHGWFRRHLPDHLLDLLVEADRARFLEHARACTACADRLSGARDARPDWWDGAGHPPVGMLLAWDASGRSGPADEALRLHVVSCESCRRDLEDLHGPAALRALTLAPVPRLAAAPSGPAWLARSGAVRAAAVVAVVAAVALVWNRAVDRAPVPAPARPAAREGTLPPAAPGPSPAPPAAAAAKSAGPVTILAPDRGGDVPVTRLPLEPGVALVTLTLPALDVPAEGTLIVELRRAGGATISRQQLVARNALRPGGVRLATAGLAPGVYVLHVGWNDPLAGESSRDYPLDVRASR
jgi:hypothetical protein